jgi:hypothetical protein
MISKKVWTGTLEWFIAIVLIISTSYYYFFSSGSFTALNEFKRSERTYNYGPSDIKRTIDTDYGKIYLSKYKDWFSASTVEKKIVKWYIGNGVTGIKIKNEDKITQSWGGSKVSDKAFIYKVFGYVTDNSIRSVFFEVEENGETKSLKEDIGEDRMFIFWWNDKENKYKFLRLRGVDASGNVVYEHKYY